MKLLARARQRPMSNPSVRLQAGCIPLIVVGGIVLAALGWLLSRPTPVRETTVAVTAGGENDRRGAPWRGEGLGSRRFV